MTILLLCGLCTFIIQETVLIYVLQIFFIFSCFRFFIPESARWLLVHNRPEEARRILQRICAAKGTKLPDDLDLRRVENVRF